MDRRWAFVVLALIVAAAGEVAAQEGSWVTHPVPDFGSGNKRLASGGKCAAFSFDQTRGILFFDTNVGSWSELDLEATRDLLDIQAAGDLVLALTDSVVIAYNARTGLSHLTGYEGSILANTGSLKSWGCAASLAYLLTDRDLYVFDADVDAWAVLDHGLAPLIPDHGVFCAKDDYIAVEVFTDFDQPRPVIVYSRHTHSFNQHPKGVGGRTSGDFYLDHGFAGVGSTSSESDPWLLGYSALTNQFAFKVVETMDHELVRPLFDHGGKGPETCALSFFLSSPAQGLGQANLFGYDTLTGHWHMAIQEYQVGQSGVGANPWSGGRFAMLSMWAFNPYYLGAKVFSGWADAYLVFQDTPLAYEGTDFMYLEGGTVLGYGGKDAFQGYDVAQAAGLAQTFGGDGYVGGCAGEFYLAFSRYTSGQSRMDTHIFNGARTTWTTVDMPYSLTPTLARGRDVLVMTSGWPVAETLFYSPLLDSYHTVNFQDGASVLSRNSATLGLAFDPDEGYLFDARTAIAHHRTGHFTLSSLGQNVCLLNDDDQNLAAYSSATSNWTTYAAGQDVAVLHAGQYLGWAETNPSRDRVIVFNSLHDSWVPIDMVGSSWSVANGGRTMVVADLDKVAAFDPESHATPTFLSTFNVSAENGQVVARWRTSLPCTPADFQLTGRRGDRSWPVTVSRDGSGGFVGVDVPQAASGEGPVSYELRLLRDGREPELLATGSATPVPAVLKFQLQGAYPNPSNPLTAVRFILDRRREITLEVFDPAGRRVATIARGMFDAGKHEVPWRGVDNAGRRVESGTYLVRLRSTGMMRSAKLMLVR